MFHKNKIPQIQTHCTINAKLPYLHEQMENKYILSVHPVQRYSEASFQESILGYR